jgi:hypothetical protein
VSTRAALCQCWSSPPSRMRPVPRSSCAKWSRAENSWRGREGSGISSNLISLTYLEQQHPPRPASAAHSTLGSPPEWRRRSVGPRHPDRPAPFARERRPWPVEAAADLTDRRAPNAYQPPRPRRPDLPQRNTWRSTHLTEADQDAWEEERRLRPGAAYACTHTKPRRSASPLVDRGFQCPIEAPPAGFEPAHPAPEAGALSPELRGLGTGRDYQYQATGCARERGE